MSERRRKAKTGGWTEGEKEREAGGWRWRASVLSGVVGGNLD